MKWISGKVLGRWLLFFYGVLLGMFSFARRRENGDLFA